MRRVSSYPQIEPLESRIAPASVVLGANTFLPGKPLLYTDTATDSHGNVVLQFIHASDPTLTGPNKSIADSVGDNASVYFIKVSAGQEVEIPTASGHTPLVNVTSGTVVAFFTDSSSTGTVGVVDAADFTGLALGNKVSVGIGVPINKNTTSGFGGDIVTDYNDATQSLGIAGNGQLLPNTVTSLSVAGNIGGNILAGGNISRLFVSGSVNEILTGNATNGTAFGFTGIANVATLTGFASAAKIAGPSLLNATIGSSTLIHLGDGGAGAAGGAINGLTLLDVQGGLNVITGNGGDGVVGRTAGGAGGAMANVLMNAAQPTLTLNPGDSGTLTVIAASNGIPITFTSGHGGAGFGTGRGGAGGAITAMFIDYDQPHTANPSVLSTGDNVIVTAGAGGNGSTGGAGGSLNNVNVITSTLLLPAPAAQTAPMDALIAGAGGSSPTGGKGGAGGSIINSQLLDVATVYQAAASTLPDDSAANPNHPTPTATQLVVEAGNGGSAAVKGAGGNGGAITNLNLKGFNFQVLSGVGGAGISSGGNGGAISTVNVFGSNGILPGDNFHAQAVVVTAGAGGAGASGKGGSGGLVNQLTIQNADFNATGLQVTGGNGGSAGKGAGGAGGAVTNIKATDLDFTTVSHPNGNTGNVAIVTGNGGAAPGIGARGGAGGAMSNVVVVGTRLNASNIATGSGGNGGLNAIAGRGGAGGAITNFAFRELEGLNPTDTSHVTDPTTFPVGILEDPNADFAGLHLGETVINANTGVSTSITSIISPTEIGLQDDIFAAGDYYSVPDVGFIGTAVASQFNLFDSTKNFITEGVVVGDTVEDLNPSPTAPLGTSQVAKVTAVTANQLTLTGDIARLGDQYFIETGSPVANITAGAGGTGNLTGAGGVGGTITNSSASALGAISFTAGAGGAGGATGAAGAGGGLRGDSGFSLSDSSSLHAGSAGATGGKAGAGGGITGGNMEALINITAISGNGTNGGVGGTISGLGFSGPLVSGGGFNAPTGVVDILAGNGGASATKTGGAGGGISALSGFISSGAAAATTTTSFTAGNGGNGVTKGGVGGSISSLRFFGGGGAGVTVTFDAGDAGNATTGKTGATGGSVSNIGAGIEGSTSGVANFSVAAGTVIHNVSAGNGGNATTKGGLGGSVSNVVVNAAIGVRTGVNFGFDAAGAGGVSAGAGGTGTTAGLAGNVTGVTADAIASIVAGHHIATGSPLEATNLATKVDGIILNGFNTPTTVEDFTLTYQGQTTEVLATNSTQFEVASALDALSTIQSAGGVSVVALPNGAGFTITFDLPGARSAITGTEEPASAFSLTPGTTSSNQVTDTINLPLTPTGAGALNIFSPLAPKQEFQNANLVGSIVSPGVAGGSTFKFTPQGPPASFVFGDVPIDGLIAAVTLTANKNFIPEAFVTEDASGHAVLIDPTNS